MSTPLQRRLQLRKPVAPGTPSAPLSTPPAAAARPAPAVAQPEPVTDHALRFLRARAAQLERQVALASAEVRSRDALVADAVAALDEVRGLAGAAAAARSPEAAQPLLRELVAYARSALAKCQERGCAVGGEEERWLVAFEPAAGNRFLTPPPPAGSWSSGARATVAGAASGAAEARALVQGAAVARLEERLASLAPALAALAQQLGAEDVAAQVDAAARELAELAALSPTRGFLFGSPAQPRAAARPAPPPRKTPTRAPPAPAASPARKPGRLPDLAGALASLPPFAPGRETDGRDGVAQLLRDAAAAEAALTAERDALRAELDAARARSAAPAAAPPAAALRAAAAPLRRVLDAGAAVERAPSEATLKGLVAAISAERGALDAALQALSVT